MVLGGLAAAAAAVGAARARAAGGQGRRCWSRARWSAALWIGARGRAARLPRRQRDHQHAAAQLHRDRAAQPPRRGAAARSGQPEQAVDAADRRRQHARQPARASTCTGGSAWGLVACLRHLGADEAHHVRLRRAHGRRQRARGAAERPAGAAADRDRDASSAALAPGWRARSRWRRSTAPPTRRWSTGYGYTGVLVAFIARAQPARGHPGGAPARRHRRQRRPAAARVRAARRDGQRAAGDPVLAILLLRDASTAARCVRRAARARARQATASSAGAAAWRWRVLGGAIRISTPFLFVSLGECLTEKSGRVNLGLEGTLVMGAMAAYGVSYLTGSPWLGVLAAGALGVRAGRAARLAVRPPARQRHRGRHRADAVRRRAGVLPRQAADRADGAAPAGDLARLVERVGAGALGAAGQRAVLVGLVHDGRRCCFVLRRTRWGLVLRTVGESADAARAMGYDVDARAAARDDGGRLPRRRRRLVPVAVLPGQLERGAVERPGADGGGAGDLRALGSRSAACARRCCSAARARSARRCSRWASPPATTCSTPRLRADAGDHHRDQLARSRRSSAQPAELRAAR